METQIEPTANYDNIARFRCTSEFMPMVHMAARSNGLTASAFMRMVITREINKLGVEPNGHAPTG